MVRMEALKSMLSCTVPIAADIAIAIAILLLLRLLLVVLYETPYTLIDT
jgi:hypothetical protein